MQKPNCQPYAVELKSTLDHFIHPGETQKWRLHELWKRIGGLHAALLQLAVRKGEYRVFCDDQLNILFFGPKAPLEPIEAWIREGMKKYLSSRENCVQTEQIATVGSTAL